MLPRAEHLRRRQAVDLQRDAHGSDWPPRRAARAPTLLHGSTHGTATCTLGTDGGGTCGISCDSGYHPCSGGCLSNGDDPSMDPCVVGDGVGVFVSPSRGDTGGARTMASPAARRSGKGITAASATSGKRVYACGTKGNYNEQVTVGASADGVHVYGGLDCGTWAYSASAKAVVSPSAANGYALHVTGLTTGATFEDMGFVGANGVQSGDSSVAVFVSGSSNVVVARCGFRERGRGWRKQNQVGNSSRTLDAPGGVDGSAVGGGTLVTNTCSNGTSM